MCPCSSVESEHLATNQGVGSSNLSRGVWAISSVELEHGASTPGVEGSNPSWPVGGRLAQLGRAGALQAQGRRFDPCTAHMERLAGHSRRLAGRRKRVVGVRVLNRSSFADVAQRSSSCLPSSRNGFDSRLPLCYAGSGRVPMSLEWTRRVAGFSRVSVRHAGFKSRPPGSCGHSSRW